VYKYLITGGAGFLGSSLIEYLLKETDHEMVSVERPTRPSKFQNNSRVKVVYHDLREPLDESHTKEIGEVEYIIHFAASTSITKSIEDPESFVANNVLGTTYLLEFARKNSGRLKQFLYFSTAEVFGRKDPTAILNEDSPLESHSPYAATKIAAQEMCMSYKNSFNIPAIIVYSMNTFGPLQAKEKYIPLLVDQISNQEKVSIHLNAAATVPNRRNYLYVDDLCDAILFLNRYGSSGEKYIIAAPQESNNLELAQTVAGLLGEKLNYELVEQKENSLVLPHLSGEKLYQLGWAPKRTLKAGLKEYIEYMKEENGYQ